MDRVHSPGPIPTISYHLMLSIEAQCIKTLLPLGDCHSVSPPFYPWVTATVSRCNVPSLCDVLTLYQVYP